MPNAIDIANQRFGRVVAIKSVGLDHYNQRLWLCHCDCGKEKIIKTGALRRKNKPTRSCGCIQREHASRLGRTKETHGMHGTSEYKIWKGMLTRCCNSNDPNFQKYGARGISICERWRNSFENFYADMGAQPSKQHSLERDNNNGNYEPTNCRWATKDEQARNKRNNIIVTLDDGSQLILKDACKLYGIAYRTAYARIKYYGWPIMRALTETIQKRP
jgi:hypothetical protein